MHTDIKISTSKNPKKVWRHGTAVAVANIIQTSEDYINTVPASGESPNMTSGFPCLIQPTDSAV